jgi:hypothetical protein
VKINRYFLLKKKIFLWVKNPQNIFTIFTALVSGRVRTPIVVSKVAFLPQIAGRHAESEAK